MYRHFGFSTPWLVGCTADWYGEGHLPLQITSVPLTVPGTRLHAGQPCSSSFYFEIAFIGRLKSRPCSFCKILKIMKKNVKLTRRIPHLLPPPRQELIINVLGDFRVYVCMWTHTHVCALNTVLKQFFRKSLFVTWLHTRDVYSCY